MLSSCSGRVLRIARGSSEYSDCGDPATHVETSISIFEFGDGWASIGGCANGIANRFSGNLGDVVNLPNYGESKVGEGGWPRSGRCAVAHC
jgi:hypothetical protein